MRFLFVLCVSLLFVSPAAAQDFLFTEEPDVRTLILQGADQIGVRPSEAVTVRNLASEATIVMPGDVPLKIVVKDGSTVILDDAGNELFRAPALRFEPSSKEATLLVAGVPFGVGWWWENQEDRLYEGQAEFRVTDDGKLNAIIILPIEEYLRGVVPSEIGSNSPEEALKSQAIAARGETLVALRTGKYAGPHYDICADVNCQVFSGNRKRSAEADAAIEATKGLALFYEDEPIGAYYASNCGGHSDNAHLAWPDRHPEPVEYWTGVFDGEDVTAIDLTQEENMRAWINGSPDVYCNFAFVPELPEWVHKSFRWERTFSADDVTTAVASHKQIGRVSAIEPGMRGPSGRLTKVTFVGENGTFEIGPELSIRRVFSPPLRSASFVVETVNDDDGRPEKFIIRGAGYGHGVGMCQVGAIGRALSGQGYEEILTHYYQGTEIKEAWPVEKGAE